MPRNHVTFNLPFKGEKLTIDQEGDDWYITRYRATIDGTVIIDQVSGCLSHHVGENVARMVAENKGGLK